MINWDLYQQQLQHSGATARDRLIAREQDALRKQFAHAPAAKTAVVDGKPKPMIVKSTQALNEKTFILMPGDTIKIGDIVVWANLHWLVVELDFDNTITYKGRLAQCNRQIRWQNPETREILERWCLITKPYTSNVTNGMQVSLSNREFKVQVPYDAETKLVDLDKRFMLELIDGKSRTYSCTSVDQQTNVYQDLENGFIVWNLSQDEAGHPGDNAELMICDYVGGGEVPPPALPAVSIDGMDILRAELGEFEYTLAGDGIAAKDVVWHIAVPAGMEQSITMMASPSGAALVAADEAAIGLSFELYVTDRLGVELARKAVEVVDAYG